jgi:hypothetical protein
MTSAYLFNQNNETHRSQEYKSIRTVGLQSWQYDVFFVSFFSKRSTINYKGNFWGGSDVKPTPPT